MFFDAAGRTFVKMKKTRTTKVREEKEDVKKYQCHFQCCCNLRHYAPLGTATKCHCCSASSTVLPKHKPISDLIIYFYDQTVSVKTNRDIVDISRQ